MYNASSLPDDSRGPPPVRITINLWHSQREFNAFRGVWELNPCLIPSLFSDDTQILQVHM